MNERRARIASWAAGLAVVAVAVWNRIAGYRWVLGSGELMPQGDGDSAYHLIRILRTLRHFPTVPTHDPLVNWPAGAECHWADGFDLAGAVFVKLIGGAGSDDAALVAASLWPAFLGIIAIGATMRLAEQVAPPRGRLAAAVGAGFILSVTPEFLIHSRFGRVDHHVFEALLAVLLASWALRACRPDAAARRVRERVAFEVEAAVLAALGIWFFTGATLYVALAVAVVLVALLAGDGPQRLVGSGAAGMIAGGLAGAALTLPALARHGRLVSFVFPSLLQPALVASAGVGLALAVWATHLRPSSGLRGRAALVAAGALAAAGVGALAAPRLAREVAAGFSGWLLHRDPWIATISEFQPLFGKLAAAGGDWKTVQSFLGWTGFFLPIALAVATWWAWRRDPRRALAFCALTAAFAALTLLQSRFSRLLIPFLAISVAVAFQAIVGVLSVRWRRLRRWRGAVAVGALAALAAADPPLREAFLVGRDAGPDPFQAAALALRLDGPAIPGRRQGVAVQWGFGHWFEYLAHRPVVVDGFGTYLNAASFWDMDEAFSKDERRLLESMDRHDLGYAVSGALLVPALTNGDAIFSDGAINDSYLRNVPVSVLAIAGSGLPGVGVRHLEHLVPVFASPQVVTGIRFLLPAVFAFERVEGARLRGTAPAGSRVVAEVELREHRRAHTWRAWTDAASDGSWSITVPLPTDFVRATLRTGSAFSVHAGEGAAVRIAVPEERVRRGGTIEVGRLPSPAPLPPSASSGAPPWRRTAL